MSAQESIEKIVRAIEVASVPYMLTGSFASAYYGTPRSTQDIDFVIDPTEEQLRGFVGLLDQTKYYVELETTLESRNARLMFNLLDLATGWTADFIFRKSRPFSDEEFRRRSRVQLHGLSLYIATLEDIVISKLEWAKIGQSQRQIADAAAMLRARWSALDKNHVEHWVEKLGLREQWAQARELAAI